MGEVVANKRGIWFPCLIVLLAILCLGVYIYLSITSLYMDGILVLVFGWIFTYGVFCILFEIATLVTAKILRIPEQQDKWKKVSYWLTVALTIVFPAALTMYLLRDNMIFSAMFIGLSCSYMLCAIIWVPVLAPYGYSGTANFAKVVQRPRYKVEDKIAQRALERESRRSNDEARRKAASDWRPDYDKVRVNRSQHGEWKQKDYGANSGLKITDQDWYEKE